VQRDAPTRALKTFWAILYAEKQTIFTLETNSNDESSETTIENDEQGEDYPDDKSVEGKDSNYNIGLQRTEVVREQAQEARSVGLKTRWSRTRTNGLMSR